MRRPIVRRAHAKLNVVLRVLGRRSDGDHEIETLLLPLELHDLVLVSPADRIEVEVTGPRADELAAAGGEGLVSAAARLLVDELGRPGLGATIRLDKRIPVAAGLGGGSADAAATLRALNDLWEAGLDDAALARLGAGLGADVPGLLAGGAVLAAGRGEVVRPIAARPTAWVVLPAGFGVRAGDAYRWWDEDGASTGPGVEAALAALRTGDRDRLGRALANDLQASVARRHPAVLEALRRLLEAGCLGAVMTGSGPTAVGLARDRVHAERIATAIGDGALATWGPPPR
ncbi:MAG: 4-diphosphocytidyl-2-C-methyl-D-erythritol kinase [Actinomycetota bacterium]|jgi:4-diphosphocytidyl-2-C-methyl-D-erythritol kinase|nr:MAG: 4-diphosphocytidyl-2-C-methyl-D-erythritol kinase [Actinomycetota bacterium]